MLVHFDMKMLVLNSTDNMNLANTCIKKGYSRMNVVENLAKIFCLYTCSASLKLTGLKMYGKHTFCIIYANKGP